MTEEYDQDDLEFLEGKGLPPAAETKTAAPSTDKRAASKSSAVPTGGTRVPEGMRASAGGRQP